MAFTALEVATPIPRPQPITANAANPTPIAVTLMLFPPILPLLRQ